MLLSDVKSTLIGVAVVMSVFGVAGCTHTDDSAPTNTKNSVYIDDGKSAADKIGADRAAAHRARLPGKGVGGG